MKNFLPYMPKPLYDIKPVIYFIAGAIIGWTSADPAVKVVGLMLFTLGAGIVLARLEQPFDEKNTRQK